mmetsp:Transcript_18175/g.16076  ORF Transcript_18175/g.16076 Transcript_18175/m.16076 type:complete len:94 (-) Transcript_18175:14-295(-)
MDLYHRIMSKNYNKFFKKVDKNQQFDITPACLDQEIKNLNNSFYMDFLKNLALVHSSQIQELKERIDKQGEEIKKMKDLKTTSNQAKTKYLTC